MNSMKKRWMWWLMVWLATVGFAGVGLAGDLEPPGPPESTMKTLDQIPPTWSQKITDASERFEIVLDGAAVLDKETGLVWEKSPDTTRRTWSNAIFYAYNKIVGGRKGWRLPTAEELASLVDTSQNEPALPSDHPFNNVQAHNYWSSNTSSYDTNNALIVVFLGGGVSVSPKTNNEYVWCVRGGHGHDGQ